MDMSELLLFAWGLALVGAITASLVVRAVDGVVHGVLGHQGRPRRDPEED
jgi:hypothetical protein